MSAVTAGPGAALKTTVETWNGCFDDSWKEIIVAEAFAHPAKFARGLIERIITRGLSAGWIRPGDTIGDPFGGIGTGGIISAYHGLKWVGVELEPKFCELAKKNFDLHYPKWLTLRTPLPELFRGDSRRFAEIVGAAAAVVTSPPYNKPFSQDHNGTRGGKRSLGTAPSSERGAFIVYGHSDGQIEGLPNGTVDSVITSPPYIGGGHSGNQVGGWGGNAADKGGNASKEDGGYGDEPGQIGRMKPGELDAVVTSPPYADTPIQGGGGNAYGAKKQFDATGVWPKGNLARTAKAGQGYGTTDGQIGDESGETYWHAMKAVYGQCYAALQPGAVMCVNVKDYIKNKTIVPLCDQTLTLLEHLGFEPLTRIHAMLVSEARHPNLFGGESVKRVERKSFFRRLAERNGSPRIDWEEVLVVRKPS